MQLRLLRRYCSSVARAELFPAELFHEPAWDLLLVLFVADADGRPVTGREVSERIRVQPAVISRWLMHLTQLHLIIGDGDGNLDDELTLSAEALDRIERVMNEAKALRLVIG